MSPTYEDGEFQFSKKTASFLLADKLCNVIAKKSNEKVKSRPCLKNVSFPFFSSSFNWLFDEEMAA
jgi:hypothetical protein